MKKDYSHNYATTVTLPLDVIAKLSHLTHEMGVNRSEVVRRAIDLLYQQVESGDYSVEVAEIAK